MIEFSIGKNGSSALSDRKVIVVYPAFLQADNVKLRCVGCKPIAYFGKSLFPVLRDEFQAPAIQGQYVDGRDFGSISDIWCLRRHIKIGEWSNGKLLMDLGTVAQWDAKQKTKLMKVVEWWHREIWATKG